MKTNLPVLLLLAGALASWPANAGGSSWQIPGYTLDQINAQQLHAKAP